MLLGVAVGIVALKVGIYERLWSMKTKQDTEARKAKRKNGEDLRCHLC
jgi:nitrogen fixation-related uncharacterized protein